MSRVKISELPSTSTVDSDSFIPLVRDGLNYKITGSDFSAPYLASQAAAEAAQTAAETAQGLSEAARDLAEADAVATAADRVQTGLDRIATAADVVSTAADVIAAADSAAVAAGTRELVFATVDAGIAAVADGVLFTVPQTGGYHFRYARVGAAAEFQRPDPVSATALAWEDEIDARVAAYASAPQDGKLLLTSTGKRWGGRLIENVWSNDAPTLNLVDAIISMRDEDGGTTPALTVSTAVDPLGNTEATRLEFASVATFSYVDQADYPGWVDALTITMAARIKTATDTPGGPGDVGIGSSARTAGAYTAITPTASWQTVNESFTGYDTSAAYDLSLLPVLTTPTYPFAIDTYGIQVYADTGPVVLPDMAAERASVMAGHAKAAAGHPGALQVDGDGWVTPNTNVPNAVMPLGRPTLTEYTLAGWVDFQTDDYAGAYATAVHFANTRDTGSTTIPNLGALGMDTNSTRYGRVYAQPGYSTFASRAPTNLLNQGPVHLAVRVQTTSGDTKQVTPYLNGVPLFEVADTIAAFEPEALLLGGTTNARTRYQSGTTTMVSPDRWADPAFYDRALTEEEISSLYMAGQPFLAPSQKKMLVIGSFDSLTAFTPAPFWQSAFDETLRPGTHFFLDAWGGSAYNKAQATDYNNATRQGLRRRALELSARHFDRVVWVCCYGRNDLVGGVMDPNTTTWQAGRDTIDGMIFEDIASVNASYRDRIRPILCTIPPAGDWAEPGATSTETARETARLAYNADCLANYEARGYVSVVNWEDYIPSGFASLQEAFIDGFVNGANTIADLDGIHWAATGGIEAAAAVLTPALAVERDLMLA